MAIEVYCDYCGRRIAERFAKASLVHPGRSLEADVRYHYCPDGCYEEILRVFNDLAKWARRSEGFPYVWRLHGAPGSVDGREVRSLGERYTPEPDEFARRRDAGTFLRVILGPAALALFDHNLVTLEEVAQLPRREVKQIKGVGPVTMRKLDEALAEQGLSYRGDRETAEASS